MYKYFIYYLLEDHQGKLNHCNGFIDTNKPIDNTNTMNELQLKLVKDTNSKSCLICNYKTVV